MSNNPPSWSTVNHPITIQENSSKVILKMLIRDVIEFSHSFDEKNK